MKITIRHENRAALVEYLNLKAQSKVIAARIKELEPALIAMFKDTAVMTEHANKSDYVYATLQEQGKASYVVYRETIAKGPIDWEYYAKLLGGTDADAERFRKAPTVRKAINRATKAQLVKLGADVDDIDA